MPTYDYQCRACGTVTELIHSMQEDGPSACELCGGELRRVIFPSGIIFKGSGFYRNDSRASNSASTGVASDTGGGAAKDGGPGKEKASGSTTPEGGSSGSKTASTDSSSS